MPPSTIVLSCHFNARFATRSPALLAARLAERGMHVAVREGNVRISPHSYTTDPEVDALLGALAELAADFAPP